MQNNHLIQTRLTVVAIIIITIVAVFISVFFLNSANSAPTSQQQHKSTALSVNTENTNTMSVAITTNDLISTGASASVLNVAELSFRFNPQVVSLVNITPNNELLSLNKTINNTAGEARIDIAKAQSNFAANTTLVTLQFIFLANTPSQLTIATSSTYGTPNSLDLTRSKLSFDLIPPVASSTSSQQSSSSSTSTSTSSASSASSRSKGSQQGGGKKK